MYTVHSFPRNIDHCLTWAFSKFEGLLCKILAKENSFMLKPQEYKIAMKVTCDAQAPN
jgi:hypothetical protein